MAGIRDAFAVFVRTLIAVWGDIFPLAIANLLWFVLCIPIVTAPAAFAGLYYVAHRVATGHEVRGARDFFAGFRTFFVKGSLIGLANILLALIIGANVGFYGQFESFWARLAQAIWLALGAFWLLVQVYLLPFLMHQSIPSIVWAYRNTSLLVLATPFFTGTIAIFIASLAIISVLLIAPVAVIGPAVIAVLSCTALQDRLRTLKLIDGE